MSENATRPASSPARAIRSRVSPSADSYTLAERSMTTIPVVPEGTSGACRTSLLRAMRKAHASAAARPSASPARSSSVRRAGRRSARGSLVGIAWRRLPSIIVLERLDELVGGIGGGFYRRPGQPARRMRMHVAPRRIELYGEHLERLAPILAVHALPRLLDQQDRALEGSQLRYLFDGRRAAATAQPRPRQCSRQD